MQSIFETCEDAQGWSWDGVYVDRVTNAQFTMSLHTGRVYDVRCEETVSRLELCPICCCFNDSQHSIPAFWKLGLADEVKAALKERTSASTCHQPIRERSGVLMPPIFHQYTTLPRTAGFKIDMQGFHPVPRNLSFANQPLRSRLHDEILYEDAERPPADVPAAGAAFSTGILPYAQYKVSYDDGETECKRFEIDERQMEVISSNIVISTPAMKSHFL